MRRRAGSFLRDLDRRLLPPLGDAFGSMIRGRRRFLTVTGSVLAVAVTIASVYAVNRPTPPSAFGAVVTIGVTEGEPVAQYVADRAAGLQRVALGNSPQTMYALVSLSDYETPDQLVATLAGLRSTTVFMRARLDGVATPVVSIQAYRIPFDVNAAMLALANRDREAVSDLLALADAVTGAGLEPDELRDRYRAQADVAGRTAGQWRTLCACVFAAVVYGSAADLLAVAERPGVRVVDAVPSLRLLDRAVFRPPLPEETGLAGPWVTDSDFAGRRP
jgi:hypothetical protein